VPTVPMRWPVATRSPAATAAEARCRYEVSKRPSAVRTVTVKPDGPTDPAKRTVPARAATTGAPTGAPTSMPRCCPGAKRSMP